MADPFAEPELLTVAAAFERFAGIDLPATIAMARATVRRLRPRRHAVDHR
jgi:lysyl-tRNA synthetase class 2